MVKLFTNTEHTVSTIKNIFKKMGMAVIEGRAISDVYYKWMLKKKVKTPKTRIV